MSPRLFREHCVDVIEQRAGSALLHERDQSQRRVFLRIDRQCRLQELFELFPILRRHRDARSGLKEALWYHYNITRVHRDIRRQVAALYQID